MQVDLEVRRFVCANTACPRRTFAEQVEGLTQRYQHRTVVLREWLERVALALAGRAGARLADMLGVAVSRSTLIRLIRALPDPPVGPVSVLGVDDFALRRGHIYATILIDCQTRRPVDVLPERAAAPLAQWLAAHPGIGIVCRDRASAYAHGIRTGAPDALQVADRFHLWQNLVQAVERCVARHRDCLHLPQPEPEARELVHDQRPALQSPHAARFAEHAGRRHTQVHALLEQGHGIRAIARHLGWGRHTVQRYARAATSQELVDGKWATPRPSKLDPFKPHLLHQIEQGRSNPADLHHEITALGFDGSRDLVKRFLRHHTGPRAAAHLPAPAPSTRQVTGWLTRHPDRLTDHEKTKLAAICQHCPELATAATRIRDFAEMLTQLTGQDLPAWITATSNDDLPGISAFARGLDQDLDAVTNGLTTQWNSGPVEGTVNRIKMIKRQMFGRANFDLLRKRILHPA